MHLRILSLSVLILSACTTDDPSPRSITNNHYVNSATGIALQFPTGWQVQPDYKFGSLTYDVVGLGPAADGFTPNVIVYNEAHNGPTDWNQILPAAHQALQAQFADLGSYHDTLIDLGGKTYAEITYTSSSGGHLLREREDLIMNRGLDVTVSYTDYASRFDANADFAAIKASMEIR